MATGSSCSSPQQLRVCSGPEFTVVSADWESTGWPGACIIAPQGSVAVYGIFTDLCYQAISIVCLEVIMVKTWSHTEDTLLYHWCKLRECHDYDHSRSGLHEVSATGSSIPTTGSVNFCRCTKRPRRACANLE